MTIRELIKRLQAVPDADQDLPTFFWDEHEFVPVEGGYKIAPCDAYPAGAVSLVGYVVDFGEWKVF